MTTSSIVYGDDIRNDTDALQGYLDGRETFNEDGSVFVWLLKSSIKTSEYPANFIPKGAKVFVGFDQGSPDGDYTTKGFYDPKTGEFHIQEVVPSTSRQGA